MIAADKKHPIAHIASVAVWLCAKRASKVEAVAIPPTRAKHVVTPVEQTLNFHFHLNTSSRDNLLVVGNIASLNFE